MIQKILSKGNVFLRLVQGLFLFNVADALLSVQLIAHERILDEANPLWGTLVTDNPTLFITIKLTIALAGCRLLYIYRHNPLARAGVLFCFLIYYALLCTFWIVVF